MAVIDLVRLQIGVELRRVAGQAMEVREGDGALAVRPVTCTFASSAASATHMSEGWVGDAVLAGAEDRVHAG